MTGTCVYCGAKIIEEKIPCQEGKCSYLHIKTTVLPQPDLTKLREAHRLLQAHPELTHNYEYAIARDKVLTAVKELLDGDK